MENKTLTLGSLFSGSGAFELAGMLAGIKPIFASEIEPFCIRITTKRLPFIKHYGDISTLNGAELEPVDIITFGSPCTDLSIAGKRSGLKAARSGLFFQAVRIIKEMRCATNGKYPKYAVFENVGGIFSSNSGEDFRTVLEELCKIADESITVPRPNKWQKAGCVMGDNFSVAYRCLDAQYWGVAQRRLRLFAVADFTGQRAGAILTLSEGLSGYSAESFRTWQEASGSAGESSAETGRMCISDQGGERIDILDDKTSTLRAEAHHPPLILENHPADSRIKLSKDNISQALTSRCGTGGGNVPLLLDVPVTLKIRAGCEGGGKGAIWRSEQSATLSCNNDQTVFVPKAYGVCSKHNNSMLSDNPNSGFYEAKTSRTLDTSNQSPNKNQGGIVVVEGNGSRPSHKGDGYKEANTMYTLNTVEHHCLAYGIDRAAYNQGRNALFDFAVEKELEPTIVAKGPGAVAHFSVSKSSHFTRASEETAETLVATDYKDPPLVNENKYVVRRLTPQECAMLMGMPYWWCSGLESENPTDEEIEEWQHIWNEWNRINGKKPKSRNQVIKWLKKPHSDSAEYKMWGNGVVASCAYFVLAGIVWADSR